MEPSIREYGKSLSESIPGMGPIKFIGWLRRNGYLTKGKRDRFVPTEKADGLLALRRLVSDNAKVKKPYYQAYVTDRGAEFFAQAVRDDYNDFGSWELSSNLR